MQGTFPIIHCTVQYRVLNRKVHILQVLIVVDVVYVAMQWTAQFPHALESRFFFSFFTEDTCIARVHYAWL